MHPINNSSSCRPIELYPYTSNIIIDQSEKENMDIRKGPWSCEEDQQLIQCISILGESRWDSLARSSGLRRTGKSCRLRWLNYLRPNLRRGNLSMQEQLLILQLHSRLGNQWSRIANYLPGRTDNAIKNFWRTRVVRLARLLNCDPSSPQFIHALFPVIPLPPPIDEFSQDSAVFAATTNIR